MYLDTAGLFSLNQTPLFNLFILVNNLSKFLEIEQTNVRNDLNNLGRNKR